MKINVTTLPDLAQQEYDGVQTIEMRESDYAMMGFPRFDLVVVRECLDDGRASVKEEIVFPPGTWTAFAVDSGLR